MKAILKSVALDTIGLTVLSAIGINDLTMRQLIWDLAKDAYRKMVKVYKLSGK